MRCHDHARSPHPYRRNRPSWPAWRHGQSRGYRYPRGYRHTAQAALIGISCLADGADQIFARAVIAAGGGLHVIVAAEEYRDGLPAEAYASYDELVAQAADVRRLPYVESTSDAHMAASKMMLDDADTLFAVWDGQPARGYGGTADIVSTAQDLNVPVHIIWPAGAHRD